MVSTRIVRTICALLLGSLVAPLPLAAQGTTASPDSGWKPHLRIGGGSVSNDGPFGLVGIELAKPGSRLSFRATADDHRHDVSYPARFTSDGQVARAIDCTTFCTDHERRTVAVLSLDAKFDLLTGRFRPYVFSGLGLGRTVSTLYVNAHCDADQFTCVLTPGEIHPFAHRAFAATLQAGVGASFRVRNVQLFGEFGMRGVNQIDWRDGWMHPMSIGIRF
jgi:hypothetical protein